MDIAVLNVADLRQLIREELASVRASRSSPDGRKPSPKKGYLTNAEALAYLGLSRQTLQRYRTSGVLPYSKLGGNVYYRLADIERLLADNLVGGSTR